MSLRRQKKIADQIQRELSDIVRRRVKDPRVENVTITGVDVSPDYQHASVYVYWLGGDPNSLDEGMQGIESAKGFIRRELGSRLTIRYTPELRFRLDRSIDYADHIESLLAQIKEERQERDADSTEDGTTDL